MQPSLIVAVPGPAGFPCGSSVFAIERGHAILLARYPASGYLSICWRQRPFPPLSASSCRLKLVMEIAITVIAVPSQEDLLLDVAAALQRDFGGALEFRWLAPGEAMDLILSSSSCPSPTNSLPRNSDRTAGAGGQARARPSPLAGEGQDEGELTSVKQIAAEAVADAPVDWCVQPAAGRRNACSSPTWIPPPSARKASTRWRT